MSISSPTETRGCGTNIASSHLAGRPRSMQQSVRITFTVLYDEASTVELTGELEP